MHLQNLKVKMASKTLSIGREPKNKVNVSAFFRSNENIEMIKRNQKYSNHVTNFIRDNISVKEDVIAQPFTI